MLNPFKRFGPKTSSSSTVSRKSSSKEPQVPSIAQSRMASNSPFSTTTPTRRPRAAEAPPAYSPPARDTIIPGAMAVSSDSPYAFLTQFDTVFLIDDSGSMAGRSWRETTAALSAITPICTTHDANGIDIYFLNHRNTHAGGTLGGYENITTTSAVENIFKSVRPLGGTPTGTRLNQILKPYLSELENSIEQESHGHEPTVKPLNIIVITDGVPSDDVESVIVNAAKKLDSYSAEPWQVGIQFFQVGREPEAAEDLQDLDDALSGNHGVRDMVDTVPWTGDDGHALTANELLKVVLGSVNRKLDRKPGRK